MTTAIGLSQCLCVQDGRIRLNVPDGMLPGFLIEAYNATIRGEGHLAQRLLTSPHCAFVDRMVAEGRPGASLASLVLAMVLHRVGFRDAAMQRYEAIVASHPHPLVLNELAEMYRDMGLPSRALPYREEALQRSANDSGIQANYALDLIYVGRLQEGITLLQGLVDCGQASESAHSCLLLYLHYLPEVDRRALFEEHLHGVSAMPRWPGPGRTTPMTRTRIDHSALGTSRRTSDPTPWRITSRRPWTCGTGRPFSSMGMGVSRRLTL